MKIYKYLKFEDAIKTLTNNSVLLNNPSNYNDPFDCLIKPSKEEEEVCYQRIINYYLFKEFSKIILDKKIKMPFWLGWTRWLLKLFKALMRKNPYYDRMPFFDGVMSFAIEKYKKDNPIFKKELETNKTLFSKKIKQLVLEIRGMLLISCFSMNYKSILMWSHYADSHKGICVEFEVDSPDFKKIKYSKKRHQLDLKMITAVVLGCDFIGEEVSKDNPRVMKALMKVLLTKSLDWQYEDEIRTAHYTTEKNKDIYPNGDKYLLKMPVIKRVYVGCRIEKKNLGMLRRDFPTIEVVELVDSDKEYKLLEKEN